MEACQKPAASTMRLGWDQGRRLLRLIPMSLAISQGYDPLHIGSNPDRISSLEIGQSLLNSAEEAGFTWRGQSVHLYLDLPRRRI